MEWEGAIPDKVSEMHRILRCYGEPMYGTKQVLTTRLLDLRHKLRRGVKEEAQEEAGARGVEVMILDLTGDLAAQIIEGDEEARESAEQGDTPTEEAAAVGEKEPPVGGSPVQEEGTGGGDENSCPGMQEREELAGTVGVEAQGGGTEGVASVAIPVGAIAEPAVSLAPEEAPAVRQQDGVFLNSLLLGASADDQPHADVVGHGDGDDDGDGGLQGEGREKRAVQAATVIQRLWRIAPQKHYMFIYLSNYM